MIKKYLLVSLVCIASILQGEIVEIDRIDNIKSYVTKHSLCLFDIDDTLIDNPSVLGTPPWRNWVRTFINEYNTEYVLFDALTLYIAKQAPYKAVEPTTAQFISDMQKEGITALAFTARGRSEWYTTTLEGVDQFTHAQLKGAGIDFTQTLLPAELQSIDPTYFYDGIIFAKHIPKGELFNYLLKDLNHTPERLIFVDDKLEQVKSMEKMAQEAGIPFTGFWYRRSEADRAHFNPLDATVQLEYLLLKGEIVTDEEAHKIAQIKQGENPKHYFKEVLNQIEPQLLAPAIP